MITNSPSESPVEAVYRLMAQGDFQAAGRQCEQLTARYPESDTAWVATTEFFLRVSRPQRALETAEKAVRLNPGNVNWQILKARCQLECGLTDQAITTLNSHVLVQELSAAQHNETGMLLARLDRHNKAQEHYEHAVSVEPKNVEFLFNLATSHRFLGEIEPAEKTLDRILVLAPQDHEAAAMRSSLKRQTPRSNHVEALEQTLETSELPPRAQIGFCYALAKELEDLEQHSKSFHYLERGSRLRREAMNYTVKTDVNIMDSIRQVFDRQFFAADSIGHDDKSPIFVMGLPRSGTTLAERILGSHSQIHAAGELGHFGVELTQLTRQVLAGNPGGRSEFVEASSQVDFAELGRRYIETTRSLTAGKPRFTDKLPFNYLYAGLIHRALPGAKIISLKRHPLDSCYAMYKQLFRDAYPFSYSQQDLAEYYIAYARLMDHWNNVLPGVIHTVQYEDLVSDSEAESRRMVEFCGLEWEPACLEFHRSKAASTTASATQVRQKIYSSSVGKWQCYSQQLQPLTNRLRDAGISL